MSARDAGGARGERRVSPGGRGRIRVRANLCRRKSTVTLDWKLSREPGTSRCRFRAIVSNNKRGFIPCDSEDHGHENRRIFLATRVARHKLNKDPRRRNTRVFAFQFTNCNRARFVDGYGAA